MVSICSSLVDSLARNLPEGLELQCYHISTPPTRCLDIYSPPAGQQSQKTYSESHSLTISIISNRNGNDNHDQVAIFAIELILYTTARLSTLFVSKADSTGYASLVQIPKGSGSLLQSITTTFISWLVRSRTRPRQRIVLSLFARAQGQYLFPGSVENDKKHVLDDRGLVKWWCKTLDPIVREYPQEDKTWDSTRRMVMIPGGQTQSKAYLIIPGLDSHETTAFFPASARQDPPNQKRWFNDHPLQQLAGNQGVPPRCMIPHFPDDPKSRFLDELDDEISEVPSSQQAKLESPTKRGVGNWKSVKTLEQFWEMMAYRQECSSGRLVGFIWIVFTPPATLENQFHLTQRFRSVSPTPTKRKTSERDEANGTIPSTTKKPRRKGPLTGLILSRAPNVKSANGSSKSYDTRPESTSCYTWPKETRGTLVLVPKEYDRVHEILLRLDFASLDVATASTLKWVREAAVVAGLAGKDWGVKVVGMKKSVSSTLSAGVASSADGIVNMLVPKRKKIVNAELNEPKDEDSINPAINTLGDGLVRKKPKSDAQTPIQTSEMDHDHKVSVNVLGSSLVRKKIKAP